ncbi:MAG: Nif3-like dinuclear metal center hexameric protein [Candidatus Altiarchaeum hamiconexum]|uniref:Nif3-like dinuclear metal center hexameric protein n=1 Tax=Candidatus Altarchaeum hamiconexum TaxID=1803513 RepID=A0A8J7YVG6_9ARCH|nr:Nif3-like dinuclear metal center hexameric protein [Candidatus Altarchaeum hamiconexum]OIQ05372.1 MAG: Nif3-like dinuclear metal center hexameric protein [Candidatus Altarchaeum sp. CG2_30_32_3053]PIN67015.1 MAG: Nif3-like dinuclear metal center hexameric protein [Candidatus Altarchaeum sp. CG12_big_fil_rev_8_21_14_0_65_33_22]PIV28881.1 MAG: Nif3-like dinuclear metal center hexameric protein [Candidatus Altarchaeum sp. CG03_land_8_20_14_0_80_32_618]PIZ29292.1 MAG: Nif3-like dinuclear metal c
MEIKKLNKFLDKYLKISEIDDLSVNGLQVEGRKDVKKICFAVDASLETFKLAKKENADMLFVHHGMIWGGIKKVTGINYKRLKFLIENEISLYATHLPLDKHREVGNNIQFLKIFGINEAIEEFGTYHEIIIGYKGKFEKERNLSGFVSEIEKQLNTKCKILKFGKDKIKSVGVVSGGAASLIDEALYNIDCFVTGEPSHQVYHIAKEGKINVIFAGHYATETLGVKAMTELIGKKFGIETRFIDCPTGL